MSFTSLVKLRTTTPYYEMLCMFRKAGGCLKSEGLLLRLWSSKVTMQGSIVLMNEFALSSKTGWIKIWASILWSVLGPIWITLFSTVGKTVMCWVAPVTKNEIGWYPQSGVQTGSGRLTYFPKSLTGIFKTGYFRLYVIQGFSVNLKLNYTEFTFGKSFKPTKIE